MSLAVERVGDRPSCGSPVLRRPNRASRRRSCPGSRRGSRRPRRPSAAGMRAAAAGVPAERASTGDTRVDVDRLLEMGALLCFRHEAVLDPAIAVAAISRIGVQHGLDGRGIAFERHGHAIDGDRQIALAEQPMQPPEAGAAAIFVDGLDIGMARSRPGLGARRPPTGTPRKLDRRGGCCSRRPPRTLRRCGRARRGIDRLASRAASRRRARGGPGKLGGAEERESWCQTLRV